MAWVGQLGFCGAHVGKELVAVQRVGFTNGGMPVVPQLSEDGNDPVGGRGAVYVILLFGTFLISCAR